MRANVLLKAFIVGGVAVAFLVPLVLILGIVEQRSRYRQSVTAEVAKSTAQSQTLVGPILIVRYRERVRAEIQGAADQLQDGYTMLLPDTLAIRSNAHIETRQRGIYRVPVFRAANAFSARFTLPQGMGIPADRISRLVGEPSAELVFGVSDPRGIRAVPRVSIDGVAADEKPGTGLSWLQNGFRVPLSGPTAGRVMAVEASLEIMGTDRLMFLPVGAVTDVTLSSDWPHPSFSGAFLPDDRRIDSRGFQAHWKLSRFATGIDENLSQRLSQRGEAPAEFDLGARFVQPVDVYTQSERAVKYGILFVFLTFVAFFLFEVLRRMAVHPIQYALCGAALALFFLLLVSLSEHLPFLVAYLAASAACIALISFYVGHVLRHAGRGLIFAGFLGALYAFLYVILQSEDYALLLGTILLFVALAAVMIMTRRVDWYRLSEEVPAAR